MGEPQSGDGIRLIADLLAAAPDPIEEAPSWQDTPLVGTLKPHCSTIARIWSKGDSLWGLQCCILDCALAHNASLAYLFKKWYAYTKGISKDPLPPKGGFTFKGNLERDIMKSSVPIFYLQLASLSTLGLLHISSRRSRGKTIRAKDRNQDWTDHSEECNTYPHEIPGGFMQYHCGIAVISA